MSPASAAARDRLVRTPVELRAAITAARPGDTIRLADGEWRDVDIRFDAQGTARRPITLSGTTAGRTAITGRSTLRIAGQHLIVRNLVFRDGQPLDGAAIATRIGDRWAEHLRLTNIMIDRFSATDRRSEDNWIALTGRNIRVDHSHFEGKQNAGAMLVVLRTADGPLDNHVRIDHNYFGPRPPLGSNTGETIRIGTAEQSLSDSFSVIEDNIFDRCSGEVEIVSIKSGGNIIRRNLFLRSQGALVLRHGNGNIVEENIFLGQGQINSGGIRIINRNQVVRNNYLEGLTGRVFTGALTLMNGVPHSAINRYHQVQGARIEGNSLIDSTAIIFGVGASEERSLPPDDVTMVRNLVWAANDTSPIDVRASMAGIRFAGNIANVASAGLPGFGQQSLRLVRRSNGLLYPADRALAGTGTPQSLRPVRRTAVGVSWFKGATTSPDGGTASRTIEASNASELARAVSNARDGDIINLTATSYTVTAPLTVRQSVTIRGTGARIDFQSSTLFALQDGGSLYLRGLSISGVNAPALPDNAVIRTPAQSMLTNYVVDIEDCRFSDMARSPAFDLIATTPGTLAARLRLANSEVAALSGTVIAAASERGPLGVYAAEEVVIDRVQFVGVGTIIDLLRDGTDESTFGPRLTLSNSSMDDSGPVTLSGVQIATITGNRFVRSAGLTITHSVGEPVTSIVGNIFDRTAAPRISELTYRGPARARMEGNIIQ
jgi:poly(beta-D-mannuronate) lyase